MCDNCASENGTTTSKCVNSPWDSCNKCGCNAKDGIVRKDLCTNNSCLDSK